MLFLSLMKKDIILSIILPETIVIGDYIPLLSLLHPMIIIADRAVE